MQFPAIQSPTADNGWFIDETNVLRPVWYKGSMLPQTIINELPTDSGITDDIDNAEEEEEDEITVDDFDYSEFIAELFNESDDEEEFLGFTSDNDD